MSFEFVSFFFFSFGGRTDKEMFFREQNYQTDFLRHTVSLKLFWEELRSFNFLIVVGMETESYM